MQSTRSIPLKVLTGNQILIAKVIVCDTGVVIVMCKYGYWTFAHSVVKQSLALIKNKGFLPNKQKSHRKATFEMFTRLSGQQ